MVGMIIANEQVDQFFSIHGNLNNKEVGMSPFHDHDAMIRDSIKSALAGISAEIRDGTTKLVGQNRIFCNCPGKRNNGICLFLTIFPEFYPFEKLDCFTQGIMQEG